MKDSAYDGIILAAAGVNRLALSGSVSAYLDQSMMLCAPGQGIVAVECLSHQTSVAQQVACLNDAQTAACAIAERTVSAGLNGNCHSPICAYAFTEQDQLTLKGRVLSEKGNICLETTMHGDATSAQMIGEAVALQLLKKGAKQLL
jgi:hydroxymethylbilane synthase